MLSAQALLDDVKTLERQLAEAQILLERQLAEAQILIDRLSAPASNDEIEDVDADYVADKDSLADLFTKVLSARAAKETR